jgi:hypothetical protein
LHAINRIQRLSSSSKALCHQATPGTANSAARSLRLAASERELRRRAAAVRRNSRSPGDTHVVLPLPPLVEVEPPLVELPLSITRTPDPWVTAGVEALGVCIGCELPPVT